MVQSFMQLKSTTPSSINSDVKQIIGLLELNINDAIFIKYTEEKEFKAEIDNCHINNMIKQKLNGGQIIFGWIIWQNQNFKFIEANFHSLWVDEFGNLFDVTPRRDKESLLLFIKDNSRTIGLIQYQNLPAIKTYDNIKIMRGKILSGIKPAIGIIQSELIYKYGFATRKEEP